MNDETTTVLVLAATLATFVFLVVQLKARRARRQHSLGDMYRPAPRNQIRPQATE